MRSSEIRQLLGWLGSLVAKIFLLIFLAPFLVMTTASAFAIGASQLGVAAGWAAATLVVTASGFGLGYWIWQIER
jgi:hypothetical protein